MEYQHTKLENGLRLITIHRPGTRTVAARFYVRAGSRFDGGYPGLAHFTEHMLFEGTTSRAPRDIYTTIEARGGEINAHTSREYISVHTLTLTDDLPLALDLLGDIILNPGLSDESFQEEKLVVLNEIQGARDQSGVLYDLFLQNLWLQNPLRNPILGTVEGLRDLDVATLHGFYKNRFVSGNALLVICGDVPLEEMLRLAKKTFDDSPTGIEQPPEPVDEPALTEPRGTHVEKDIHRTHMLLGVPTVGLKHPGRSALKVIELILGMGGSGRLYQRLREELGLVYAINTVSSVYEDAGFLGVRAVCAPENLTAVQDAILDEWADLRESGISKGELAAAKGNYTGTLTRRFETNLSVAGIFGIEGLLYQVEPFEQAIARINGVTRGGVQEAAQRYLNEDGYVLVTMGSR
ncbi:MAG: insulinase family protein [Anaerolineales bacterium]|nr:insulinase family protein [Anaerolineales bacterium]